MTTISPVYDTIIIGAGAAGLSAARKLEAKGYKVLLLEAADAPGGRVKTITTPNGLKANAGAHFCHGRDQDPAAKLAQSFGLEYTVDEAANTGCYFDGKVLGSEFRDGMFTDLSAMLENLRAKDPRADMSIKDLVAKHPKYADFVDFWRRVWSSARSAEHFSLRDFLDDSFGAGGFLLKDGMYALIDRLKGTLKEGTLRCQTPVASVTRDNEGYTVLTSGGEALKARAVILTASVEILQKNAIDIQSVLSPEMKEQISDKNVAMGNMEKMVFDLPPDFIAKNPTMANFHGELVNSGFYLFVGSAGKPMMSVLIGGEQADDVGRLTAKGPEGVAEVKRRLIDALKKNGVLADCIPYLEEQTPYISTWGTNPYTRGAYSVSVVGGNRQPAPLVHDGFAIAGEAFSPYTGHMGGAIVSGETAADALATKLGPSLAATSKGPYAGLGAPAPQSQRPGHGATPKTQPTSAPA